MSQHICQAAKTPPSPLAPLCPRCFHDVRVWPDDLPVHNARFHTYAPRHFEAIS